KQSVGSGWIMRMMPQYGDETTFEISGWRQGRRPLQWKIAVEAEILNPRFASIKHERWTAHQRGLTFGGEDPTNQRRIGRSPRRAHVLLEQRVVPTVVI